MEDAVESEVEALVNRALACFDPAAPTNACDLLVAAWERLPEPRPRHPSSFLVAKYLTHLHFNAGDLGKASRWVQRFLASDAANRSYGESEVMAAKIALERGAEAEAAAFLRVAHRKSDGRALRSESTELRALLDLPPPPGSYSEAIEAGDRARANGDIAAALEAYRECLRYDEGLTDPGLHVRLGGCYLSRGDDSPATDHLTRAYMLGGPEAFEDEDPALVDHLRAAGIL